MNYIREINAFYDWLETNSLSTSCIVLWHALMAINNKARWAYEFTVAISTLETKTGLKKKTIERCRNTLQQKGLIDWKERKGNQPAIYTMKSLCVIIDPQTVAQSVPQTVPQHVAQSVAINKLNQTTQEAMANARMRDTDEVPILEHEDFLKVEQLALSLLQRPTIYPDEFQMLKDLVASGVPLPVIMRGVRESFEQYKPKSDRDRIARLTYCKNHILDLHDKLTYSPKPIDSGRRRDYASSEFRRGSDPKADRGSKKDTPQRVEIPAEWVPPVYSEL